MGLRGFELSLPVLSDHMQTNEWGGSWLGAFQRFPADVAIYYHGSLGRHWAKVAIYTGFGRRTGYHRLPKHRERDRTVRGGSLSSLLARDRDYS